MKVLGENKLGRTIGGEFHMMREHEEPGKHIPPHKRKALMHVEFGEEDWIVLQEVFGDDDTAVAAAAIIKEAPPEIQILAIQLINIIGGGLI